jgi:hypothetical protein
MNRPEWAQGEEWEGWKPDKHVTTILVRDFQPLYMEIGYRDHDIVLRLWMRHEYVEITVKSPESALRIANCIAEEMGGWK